ncbi:MAG: ABC transporter permease [Ruminococcus sp.]|nr:ABC transporter permease [Ruminococcus sp.]
MTASRELKFESPSFFKRIKGMLGVDFYRLFHTPMFYIFLCIAAFIPALILGTTGMENPDGTVSAQLYTNAWNAIAADTPLYTFNSIGEYANMNMVFIFGGIMVSIFIGHDYKSGYVKQLFTTHAKKQDYMISKSITCAFAMACMCITYLLGSVVSGLLVGLDFTVNAGSLFIAILSKMIMSLGWASLYTFLNVIFRKYFGVSIASSFFFGTGLPIIAIGMIFGDTSGSALNIFLYGSSVNACLSSNMMTLIICIVCSAAWAIIYNLVGTAILSKSDVY